MSCKVMYTCDHCGKEVSPYIGKQWKASFLTVKLDIDDIHACSKEHLTLALAKTFDIPLDASTLRLVTEKNEALETARAVIIERDNMRARLAELEARMPANEVTNAERMQYETTIELQQKRIEELEKRIAELTPPDTSTESGLPGAVLAAITLPTKPTKPLRERLEELATYWYRDDKDDKELNGAYRLARQECAKELREVINDPR